MQGCSTSVIGVGDGAMLVADVAGALQVLQVCCRCCGTLSTVLHNRCVLQGVAAMLQVLSSTCSCSYHIHCVCLMHGE